ncbi:MAG: hypothetical protein QOD09_3223 [Bradyrhizobium sp.]|jgi:hypothetical protein|nr:hypothetical protein [Bradyrhizobium sp.]
MTSLRMSLDDTDFESLVETARSLIPALTPRWTDHNTHDPGIMLLELLAWAADQEIYALGRMRTDERLGYAALLGLRPHGPEPARGLIWPNPVAPSSPPSPASGIYLDEGTAVAAKRDDAPPFLLDHGLYVTPARVSAIETVSPEGARAAWPIDAIARGAPLLAFGTRPRRGAALELTFDGTLLTAPPGPSQRPLLSIGFRAEDSAPDSADMAPGVVSAQLQAELEWPGQPKQWFQLPVVDDRTFGFTRSGIVLLDLAAVPAGSAAGSKLHLTLRSRSLPVPPRITAVALNVLAVRQEDSKIIRGIGTGQPDQELKLDPVQVRFGNGVAPLTLVMQTPAEKQEWRRCDDLLLAGPEDRVFTFDTATGVIGFGNGLNGALPPFAANLAVPCILCQGKTGNLPAGLSWNVAGLSGFGNPDPISGGTDRLDMVELRREARRRAADDRPLVTNSDLEAAAKGCMDLRVARAHALPGFDPDCPRGRAGASRTLVVLSSDPSRDDTDNGPETAAWLRALRRRLTPHLALGDRVRVIGPRYVALRLRVVLTVAPGRSAPATIENARRLLQSRLAAVPACAGDACWPLGRDVEPRDLKGWLRKLDGVVAVRDLRIGSKATQLGDKTLKIPPHGLPQLTLEPDDITVVVATGGGA